MQWHMQTSDPSGDDVAIRPLTHQFVNKDSLCTVFRDENSDELLMHSFRHQIS